MSDLNIVTFTGRFVRAPQLRHGDSGSLWGVVALASRHLARIFHREIEQRSGERVRRLDITQPNENATRRFFFDRL
jgi:hypothetical protein